MAAGTLCIAEDVQSDGRKEWQEDLEDRLEAGFVRRRACVPKQPKVRPPKKIINGGPWQHSEHGRNAVLSMHKHATFVDFVRDPKSREIVLNPPPKGAWFGHMADLWLTGNARPKDVGNRI